MTCDRLEPDFPCSGLRSFWLSCAAFAAVVAEVDAAVRFLTDFDIEISIRQGGGPPPPPTEAPPRRESRRGGITARFRRPGLTAVPLELQPIATPFCRALCRLMRACGRTLQPRARARPKGDRAERQSLASSSGAANRE